MCHSEIVEAGSVFILKAQLIPLGYILAVLQDSCKRTIGHLRFIRSGKGWNIFRKSFNRIQKKEDNSRAGQLNAYPSFVTG